MGVWFQKSVPGEIFFLSQKYHLNFKHSASKTLWEPFQVRDIFLDPQRELCGCGSLFLMDSVQPGTHACSILTPDLLMLKEKKNWKKIFKKSCGYLVSCTVALFSSKIKLYKLWARFIRKQSLLLTREFFLNILFFGQNLTTTCFPN